MSRNLILGLLGLVAFVVLLVVVWGSGRKPKVPARTPGTEPIKSVQAPAIPPAVPAPGPKTQTEPGPRPPLQPGPVEQPKVEPGEEPKETSPGAEETQTPPPAPESEVEKAHITSDAAAMDEAARAKAAEHQEVPAPWLGSEKKTETEGEKAQPDTYVLQTDMSLYRVAEVLYGDAEKWHILLEANKDAIETPEKVKAGTKLQVPDPGAYAGSGQGKKKPRLSDGLF